MEEQDFRIEKGARNSVWGGMWNRTIKVLNTWDTDLCREVEVRSLGLELAVCVKGSARESYKCDEGMEWCNRAKWGVRMSKPLVWLWMYKWEMDGVFGNWANVHLWGDFKDKEITCFFLSSRFLCSAFVLKPLFRERTKRLQNKEGSKKKQTNLFLGIFLTDTTHHSWVVWLHGGPPA